MNIAPYPLTWPTGRARNRGGHPDGTFKRTVSQARDVIESELGMMRVASFVISTNMVAFNRGEPADSGVAVWFLYKGEWRCVAVDHYRTVRANLCGVAASLEALRTLVRHGGIEIFDQAMAGFSAPQLPQKATDVETTSDWWDVLQVARTAPIEIVEAAYKSLALKHHPDRGGDPARMSRINAAIDAAREEKRH